MANNMKSYPFALLLFLLLLLLHQSPCFAIRPMPPTSSGTNWKVAGVQLVVGVATNFITDWVRRIFGPPSPPPPPAPAVEITGQSQIKEQIDDSPSPAPSSEEKVLHLLYLYFYSFGYMNSSNSFPDHLDNAIKELRKAVATYKNHFNLTHVKEIKYLLSHPRCGVPDRNFDYELTSTETLSWPKGKWFPDDTKVLTYGFLRESHIPSNFTEVFRGAFNWWSEVITNMNLTKLNFTETTYDAADIKIGFYTFYDDIEDVVTGDSIVQFQGDKIVGNMRLDATKNWVLPSDKGTWSPEEGYVYLETVAMHQIGHLLGLNHSVDHESIMYPYILPSKQHKVQLSHEDEENIKQLYTTTSGGHFTLSGSSTLLLVTLVGISVLLY